MAGTLTESRPPAVSASGEPADAEERHGGTAGGNGPATAGAPPGPEASAPAFFAGRYQTLSEIGRGGMGQVFLARDGRLGRKVAIKVVRAGAGDPEARAQLEREARLIASLHHPNILEVHDFGIDGGAPFLVQELLEGRTLKEALAQEPMAPRAVLGLAVQVARGVAAAHEKGVVHCDLKPSNLFLSSDGTLKILDFGVARLAALPVDGTADSSGENALPRGFSGTPAYSSPEQLRCEAVDARSDLFSLGIVLYEMLAGARPFTGKSQVMVSFAVLTRTPPPLPKTVPRGLARIVLRCLEKDPARRHPSAAALLRALEQEVARPSLSPALRALRGAGLALGVLALAAVAVAAVRPLLRPGPSVQQITYLPGAVWSARFAPGGQAIFYGEAFDGQAPRVLKTRLGHPEEQEELATDALPLAAAPDGSLALLLHPEFSHNGFVGALALRAPEGGPPRQFAASGRAADFGPDGMLALSRIAEEGSVVEYPPGTVLFAGSGKISQLRVSPSGEQVGFIHQPKLTDDGGDVVLVDRAGRARTLVTGWASLGGLAWAPSGEELFFSGLQPGAPAGVQTLHAVNLAGRQRRLPLQNVGDLDLKDASDAGRFLLTQPSRTLGLAAVDQLGERVLSQQDEQLLQDLSPDGTRVLFTTDPRIPSGDGYLYVKGTDGSPAVHIGTGYGGALSPDGRTALIFPWAHLGQPLHLRSLATAATEQLPWATLGVLRARYFGDGARVLLVAHDGASGNQTPRLFKLALAEKKVEALSPEAVDARYLPVVSADGRTVVAVSAAGRMTRWQTSGGAGRPVEAARPGEVPYTFARDGGLLVGQPAAGVLALSRLDLDTGGRRPWKSLHLRASPSTLVGQVLLANDGATMVYSTLGWKTHLYVADQLQ